MYTRGGVDRRNHPPKPIKNQADRAGGGEDEKWQKGNYKGKREKDF